MIVFFVNCLSKNIFFIQRKFYVTPILNLINLYFCELNVDSCVIVNLSFQNCTFHKSEVALSHGRLGNLGKMAPLTVQKIKATLTGQKPDDDSLITEVNLVILFQIISLIFLLKSWTSCFLLLCFSSVWNHYFFKAIIYRRDKSKINAVKIVVIQKKVLTFRTSH